MCLDVVYRLFAVYSVRDRVSVSRNTAVLLVHESQNVGIIALNNTSGRAVAKADSRRPSIVAVQDQ
jgi:hypothetical protein